MDTIQEENWSDMVKEYPYSISGHDKEGRPGKFTAVFWVDIHSVEISS